MAWAAQLKVRMSIAANMRTKPFFIEASFGLGID
jgi:hypothetical protein